MNRLRSILVAGSFVVVYNTSMPSADDIIELVRRMEREAYQRGWDEAIASIMAATSRAAGPAARPSLVVTGRAVFRPGADPDMPIIEVINRIIDEKPGLRGIDIFRQAVQLRPGTDIKTMDRSGRTALARLKKRGKIHQRNHRWYPSVEEAKKNKASDTIAGL